MLGEAWDVAAARRATRPAQCRNSQPFGDTGFVDGGRKGFWPIPSLLHLAGDNKGARRLAEDVRGLPDSAPSLDEDGSPIPDPNVQMRLWVRLLDDPPLDPADLVHKAEKYLTKNKGAAMYVSGAALLPRQQSRRSGPLG